jgi:riboflavin synthase
LHKGSIALHGVSLTVNEVKGATIQVCLIPETLRKTNLKLFQVGDLINLETDLNVKSLLKTFDNKELLKKLSEQIRLSESEFL